LYRVNRPVCWLLGLHRIVGCSRCQLVVDARNVLHFDLSQSWDGGVTRTAISSIGRLANYYTHWLAPSPNIHIRKENGRERTG
jgi:hypothetical protein